MFKKSFVAAAIAAALVALLAAGSPANADPPLRTYRVTLENLTNSQPFSPGIAVTHRPRVSLFDVGAPASTGIESIAEDGNQADAVSVFTGSDNVTDVFDINRPITRDGTVVGTFTDSITFDIMARPGDRLSLATMLICTNDGITGLDSVRLPANGSVVYPSAGYDAGTENNTEQSEDIVDACGALGPSALAGDPNGNIDGAVDTNPHGVIAHHPNILGGADLSATLHDWSDPVAAITIERID